MDRCAVTHPTFSRSLISLSLFRVPSLDAMILAAGLGTRLRPLTDRIPKALIDVGGIPILERVARRLVDAGADRLIINVHHLAGQIQGYFYNHAGLGAEVLFSIESEQRLETGGGLKHAAPLLRKDAPFFMHNADVFTDIDLKALYRDHIATGALATLAVRPASTPRYLVQDASGRIIGYGNAEKGQEWLAVEPDGPTERVDFLGIQVISPRIFDVMTETGVFSIIDVYFRLTRAGETIRAFRADDALWIDIGTPERLEEARGKARDFGF